MTILVLTNLYPPHYLGGYELICFHVANALHARGHAIHILTSDHGTCRSDSQPDGSRAILPPAATHFAPAPITIQRNLRIHGFYGHAWLGVRKLRHLEFHNNQVLRNAIATHRPDIVYVWNMGGLSKSMLFTLQQLNVPTAFYISDHWIARGLSSDVWLRWWNRNDVPPHHRIIRHALERAGVRRYWTRKAPTNHHQQLRFDRISFCSRALRDLTAAAGFNVNHAAVIHAPVNMDVFHAPPKPAGQPIRELLYVGRLSPDKGVMTALCALAKVQKKVQARFTLYGRGDPEYVEQLKRFAAGHQLRVEFASATLDEMPRVYPRYDALIFPSEWAEPFALTPLEAMACGLPVIGTTTGGSAELFRHAENALTFTAGNSDELADRILELHRNSALRLRIATTAHHEVRCRYAEPLIVDQIEALLADRTAGSSNGSAIAPSHDATLEPPSTSRFTIDGSDDLEICIADLCRKTREAVLDLVPETKIEALLLGGGYGRGEGGVLRTSRGDRPYNDLEFYLFLRAPQPIIRRRYRAALHHLAQQIGRTAGVDVEITPISKAAVERSAPSMFYYDLIAGHRVVFGSDTVFSRAAQHRHAANIPISEATRLLMNRASGLLFARERLSRVSINCEDADFVGRNIAKARLALGDVVLTVFGQYHWSCRIRHERLRNLRFDRNAYPPPPNMPAIIAAHQAGVEFKLHPYRAAATRHPLMEAHNETSLLARDLWLWLEQKRLERTFRSPEEYALWPGNKCPETRWWRNILAHAASSKPADWLGPRCIRYPREQLLNSLTLLLWESDRLHEPHLLRVVQLNLRTRDSGIGELIQVYLRLWSRFNS